MIFWLICGLLTVIAVGILLLPLVRAGRANPSHERQGLAVYRDQLTEVERDRERGLLDDEQARAATLEIERRILSLSEELGREPGPVASAGRAAWLIPSVLLSVPAAALGLYLALGSPGTPDLPLAERPEAGAGNDIASMAEGLAKRLSERGGTAEDWSLLARTYAELGRHAQAAIAAGEAIAQGMDDAETQSFRGEMLTAAAGGQVVQEARSAFATALEQDANNSRALFYSGLALAQDGRLQAAYDLWTTLARATSPDAPWLPMLRQQIGRLAEDLGVTVPSDLAVAAPSEPAGDSEAPRGPSAADVAAAQDMTPEERQAFIRSMVQNLAERMEATPDNLDGWLRLSRAYLVLGERAEASAALERAEALVAALPEASAERAAVEAAREALQQVQ